MAYYKMNRFHWHLTDAQGWRIEIKQYPKLATIGGEGCHSDPDTPAQYYTQEQIRDIIAYAKERHIEIIKLTRNIQAEERKNIRNSLLTSAKKKLILI